MILTTALDVPQNHPPQGPPRSPLGPKQQKVLWNEISRKASEVWKQQKENQIKNPVIMDWTVQDGAAEGPALRLGRVINWAGSGRCVSDADGGLIMLEYVSVLIAVAQRRLQRSLYNYRLIEGECFVFVD